MNKNYIIFGVISLALAFYLSYFIYIAFKSGVVTIARGVEINKNINSFGFYTTLVVQIILAIIFFVAGFFAILGLI